MSTTPLRFSESDTSSSDIGRHEPVKYAGIFFSKLVFLIVGLIRIPVAITKRQVNDEISALLLEATVTSINLWKEALVLAYETKGGMKKPRSSFRVDPATQLSKTRAISKPLLDYARKWNINLSIMSESIPESFIPACSAAQVKSIAANIRNKMAEDNITLLTAVSRSPNLQIRKVAMSTTTLILVFEDGSSAQEKLPKKSSIRDAIAMTENEVFAKNCTTKMTLATAGIHKIHRDNEIILEGDECRGSQVPESTAHKP